MKRVVIVGVEDKFSIYFSKYLILNNIEVYFVVRKDEEFEVLNELGNKVTIVKYDGNTEHLKLFIKSIEPNVIYNLLGMYNVGNYYNNIRELLDKNYYYVVDILEALTENSKIKFVNMIEMNSGINDKNAIELYPVIIKSIEPLVKYYKSSFGINVIVIERTNDEKLDIENLISVV